MGMCVQNKHMQEPLECNYFVIVRFLIEYSMPHANGTHPACNEYVTFRKLTTLTPSLMPLMPLFYPIVYSGIVAITLRLLQ